MNRDDGRQLKVRRNSASNKNANVLLPTPNLEVQSSISLHFDVGRWTLDVGRWKLDVRRSHFFFSTSRRWGGDLLHLHERRSRTALTIGRLSATVSTSQ